MNCQVVVVFQNYKTLSFTIFFLHLSAILQYSYHLLYNDHKDFLVIGKFDFASRLPIITDKNRFPKQREEAIQT